MSVSFAWNTTDFAKGIYTITAYVTPVSGEKDTEDNTLISPLTVHVVMPGDGDADGNIDIYDVVMITSIYGLKSGEAYFNPNVDWLEDGVINIYDVVVATSVYGQKDP